MKRANGQGTIVKLAGNRRRPYAIRKVIGWKEDGRPILKYISYHRTYTEADRALKRYNDDPYTLTNKTFKQVYDEWYDMHTPKRSPKTVEGYDTNIKHLAPLHDMKIREIDRLTLQRFYNDLDVSKSTFTAVRVLAGMVFEYAVKCGILPTTYLTINDAVIMPEKPEVRKSPRKRITNDDINRLWELKDINEYARILLVYIYTGLRFEELYELQPEDCHDDYIEIRHSKTAAGLRTVPLSDKVKSLLPIKPITSYTTLRRNCKKLLPNNTLHDTRHTFITLMAEAGVDPRIVKAIVGHKPNDVTELYTHIGIEKMLEAVNRL